MTSSNSYKLNGIQTLLEFSSSSPLTMSFVWSTWPTLILPSSPSLFSQARPVKFRSKIQWSTSLYSPILHLCCKTTVMCSRCHWFPRQRFQQLLVCTHLPRITMVAMPHHCWYCQPIHPPWSSPMATGSCITVYTWIVVRYGNRTSHWTAANASPNISVFLVIMQGSHLLISYALVSIFFSII